MKFRNILAMIVLIALGGCGLENTPSVAPEGYGMISAEEVTAATADSAAGEREGYSIIHVVGGQLLELAYDEYCTAGRSEYELNQLPSNLLSYNLLRLYRDIGTAVR